MWKRVLPLVMVLLAPLGCGREPAGDTIAGRSELRIAIPSDPLDLDPHNSSEEITNTVCAHLFDPIVFLDRNMKIVPWVASSWRNPDALTWLITLRSDVRFHDGSLLTAADVVFSIRRIQQLERSSRKPFVVSIASVEALSAREIKVVTRQPYTPLMAKLSQVFVAPARYYRRHPYDYLRFHPLGSGPYRLARLEPGREVVLEAVPRHWRFARLFQTVRFLTVSDEAERTRRLLAGEVDLIKDIAPASLPALTESELYQPVIVSGMRLIFLGLTFRPVLEDGAPNPFVNPEVRHAISMGLDRDRLVRQSLSFLAEPAGQILSPLIFGYAPGVQGPSFDPGRARQILEEQGFPFDREFRITYPRHKYFRIEETVAECGRQLQELGLRFRPEPVEVVPFLSTLMDRRYDCFACGWLANTGDASDFFENCFHSGRTNPSYGFFNPVSYADPEMDRLIEQSASLTDRSQRLEALQAISRRCTEEQIWLPLFFLKDTYGLQRELQWRPRYDRYVLAFEMSTAER